MKFLRRLLPHWMLHDWQHLERFVVENREVERQKCATCQKTRVSIDYR